MSLDEITAGMANERERERLAEIAELIKRVWVVVTKLSLRTVLREKVQFRARQTRTFVMPAPVSKGVNSQGNSYTTYSNGGYSYSNAPSSSNSNSGSHYYSPSGGTSGFYTQNGERAPSLADSNYKSVLTNRAISGVAGGQSGGGYSYYQNSAGTRSYK